MVQMNKLPPQPPHRPRASASQRCFLREGEPSPILFASSLAFFSFSPCKKACHCSCSALTLPTRPAAVTYPRAVQRNLIKGLATYNILHNPVYKEQFAITWKFAMKHRRVKSVLLYDSTAGTAYDESLKDADALRAERLRRVSALPIVDKRELELRKKKEDTNKRMLKLVQGRAAMSRPIQAPAVSSMADDEGKEEPPPSHFAMPSDGGQALRRGSAAGPRRR